MRAHERRAPQSGERPGANPDAAAEAAAAAEEHRPTGHHPHGRLLRSDADHDWWHPSPNAQRVEVRSRATGELVEVLPCGPQDASAGGSADSGDESGVGRHGTDTGTPVPMGEWTSEAHREAAQELRREADDRRARGHTRIAGRLVEQAEKHELAARQQQPYGAGDRTDDSDDDDHDASLKLEDVSYQGLAAAWRQQGDPDGPPLTGCLRAEITYPAETDSRHARDIAWHLLAAGQRQRFASIDARIALYVAEPGESWTVRFCAHDDDNDLFPPDDDNDDDRSG